MQTEIIFTFTDTRNAVNGEKALVNSGVRVRVMSRPAVLGQGCGICLRVGEEDRARAGNVLQQAGIVVEKVYYRRKEANRVSYSPV